ncbi:2-oxoglutarate and iron-dependent oxygenase domain-containing protein [Kitasatospora sp. NPDC093102]|uniref:2-oxoglutarate and iron-dependent oxygenase domain-containing protein n=1 Tax=Kitasatospora sp. NPDC093102 TaxID=3155069 RepID=UPI00343ED40B
MSELQTFHVPENIAGSAEDIALGEEMVRAWQRDGIFQVATDQERTNTTKLAYEASRRFFEQPLEQKSRHVSDLTYSGYIASGEEITAGEADYSEIFTVCKDVPENDPRVRESWPCHGPTPWPDADYRQRMTDFMADLGSLGDRLLRLTALGLGLPLAALTDLAEDGWHHMRVLRFPAASATSSRGIGAHTDYGMLVIATQDEVGGLFVRPPVEGEPRNRNWLESESTAGMYENQGPWNLVTPVPDVLTVFPGDILQYLTGSTLLSTPHKVRLGMRRRFAMAYFHEPNFQAVARPLIGPVDADDQGIHYGTHFTTMFMRCYPERVTTRRIEQENRLEVLTELREKAQAG